MQTDTIQTWQVNIGDYITLGSDTAWKVFGIEDEDTTIKLALQDDDGTVDVFDFMWDDDIEVVTSFEDVDAEPVEV